MEITLSNRQKLINNNLEWGYNNNAFIRAFVDNIVNCMENDSFNITENDIIDMTEFAFKIFKHRKLYKEAK